MDLENDLRRKRFVVPFSAVKKQDMDWLLVLFIILPGNIEADTHLSTVLELTRLVVRAKA